jgi:hypothetical protein
MESNNLLKLANNRLKFKNVQERLTGASRIRVTKNFDANGAKLKKLNYIQKFVFRE